MLVLLSSAQIIRHSCAQYQLLLLLFLCDPHSFFIALITFRPTSYTVTEGVDRGVRVAVRRSGDTSGSTTFNVTILLGTSIGTGPYPECEYIGEENQKKLL